MILGAEIGLLVYGIIVLIRGNYCFGKGRIIQGTHARLLGSLCFLPLPLSAVAGFMIGFMLTERIGAQKAKVMAIGMEAAILTGVILVLVILSRKFYKQQQGDESTAIKL